MEKTDKALIGTMVVGTLLGVLLSRFSLLSLFMTVPLLFASRKVRRTSYALLPFAVLFLVVVLWTVVENRSVLGTEYSALLAVGLLIPVSEIVGSAVWVASRDRSSSFLRRFFWASIPVFVFGLALSLYLASDASLAIRNLLAETVLAMFPSEALSVDISSVVSSVVDSLMLVYAPMTVLMLFLPVVLAENIQNKYDEQWQFGFANMKFPDSYIWVFFASWALALATNFIGSIPAWVMAFAWNLALTMAVLYGIVGISIIVAFVRRRTAAITAGRIVMMLVLLCLVPVLNAAVLIALPVLGVLETWIRFR